MINLSKLLEVKEEDPEPKPDVAFCQACDWRGKVSECDIEQEGEWETGYYMIHICPKCEDGSCIEYDMSKEQAKKWSGWFERKGKLK